VNAVAPGPFESDGARENLWPDEGVKKAIEERIPLRRFAHADEVAAQCLWLLSPACDYVTGACLVIDGGASVGGGMWEAGSRSSRRRKDATE
jgi:NAD(P)-dependent dehydrogenase (short-subunit alcohol dehydrogenase family)